MTNTLDFYRLWEVRPTLRLRSDVERSVLDGIQASLRQHPNVTFAGVWGESTVHREGIVATIVLTQPSTPGAAVDEATQLLAAACAAAGLVVDVIKEVVVEMAGVDPRSL